jgi:integral membrane protein (TIGR01906 family)
MKTLEQFLARYVLPVITPLFLLMTAVRLLLTPVYPVLEYRTPSFPPDSYGFTFEERMEWSQYAVSYLVNEEDISYLGDLAFPDGSQLFNDRELGHMVDVKNVVQGMLSVWYLLGIILIGSGVFAWQAGWLPVYWRSLSLGGKLTIGLIIMLLIGVAIGFRALFTVFHLLFFKGDSWIFLFSDTLIRLFPMRFWSDSFIYVGLITIIGAFGLIVINRTQIGVRNETEDEEEENQHID